MRERRFVIVPVDQRPGLVLIEAETGDEFLCKGKAVPVGTPSADGRKKKSKMNPPEWEWIPVEDRKKKKKKKKDAKKKAGKFDWSGASNKLDLAKRVGQYLSRNGRLPPRSFHLGWIQPPALHEKRLKSIKSDLAYENALAEKHKHYVTDPIFIKKRARLAEEIEKLQEYIDGYNLKVDAVIEEVNALAMKKLSSKQGGQN